MQNMTQQEIARFDAGEFQLMKERAQALLERQRHVEAAHRGAGDKRFRGGWASPDSEVLSHLRVLGDARSLALLSQISGLDLRIDQLTKEISALEGIYQAQPWNRYYPCLNKDGHIHASLRGCPTVRQDTDMGWATQMSGLTPDEAIHGVAGQFDGLGETLCSVCFPGAPAEWCRTRSEVTRSERQAAKAEKDAERDARLALKNLAEAETARFGGMDRYDRPKTVAAARALVRKPAETMVELEWNRTAEAAARWSDQDQYRQFIRNLEGRLARETADAEVAAQVLADREDALPGSGQARAESDTAYARKLKAERAAWFR
jgi:hypothetical protein